MSQPSTNSIHAVTPLHLLSRLLVRFHVARVALWYVLVCERCARTSPPAETERDAVRLGLASEWEPVVRPDPDTMPDTSYECPDCARMTRNEIKTVRTMTERNLARADRDAARAALDALFRLTNTTGPREGIPWENTEATQRALDTLYRDVTTLKALHHASEKALDAIADSLGCNDPFENIPALGAACLDAIKLLRADQSQLRMVQAATYVDTLTAEALKTAQADREYLTRELDELRKIAQGMREERDAARAECAELTAAAEARRIERDHAREDYANLGQRFQILENALIEIRGGRLAPCACRGTGCDQCTDAQGMPRDGVVGFVAVRGTL